MPDKFLTAADLGDDERGRGDFKTVLVDRRTGRPVVPNGSLGFRYSESGMGKWNLDLEGVDPALSLLRGAGGRRPSRSLLPRFDVGQDGSEGGGVASPRRAGAVSRRRPATAWSPRSST